MAAFHQYKRMCREIRHGFGAEQLLSMARRHDGYDVADRLLRLALPCSADHVVPCLQNTVSLQQKRRLPLPASNRMIEVHSACDRYHVVFCHAVPSLVSRHDGVWDASLSGEFQISECCARN